MMFLSNLSSQLSFGFVMMLNSGFARIRPLVTEMTELSSKTYLLVGLVSSSAFKEVLHDAHTISNPASVL